jgi:hypothetical protein
MVGLADANSGIIFLLVTFLQTSPWVIKAGSTSHKEFQENIMLVGRLEGRVKHLA